MKLHAPFVITARLLPGLRVGDATLSLDGTSHMPSGRTRAVMILDFPDGSEYRDDTLSSGLQGFDSVVDIFESYLSFLSSAAESVGYEARTGRKSGNGSLFPPHIMQWAADNSSVIEAAHCDLRDDEGRTLSNLIED